MLARPGQILIVIATIGYSANAWSQTYTLPADPVAPTSFAQCRTLREQYNTIFSSLDASAQRLSQEALKVWVSSGLAAAMKLMNQANQLLLEGRSIIAQAAAAYQRCAGKVEAYEASQGPQDPNSAVGRSSENSISDSAGRVGVEAGLSGLKTLDRLDGIPSGFKAVASTLDKASGVGRILYDLSGSDGAGGYLNQGINTLSQIEGWNPLRTFIVKGSLAKLLDIHSAVSEALQNEMSQFDSTGLANLLASARQADDISFGEAGTNLALPQEDSLSADLLEAYRENRGMYAGRGKAYDDALRAVKDQYNRVMSPTANRSTPVTTGGSGSRYPRSWCNALLAQIQEYRRVLPQYEAAGHGTPILMGIQANQRVFDERCR